MVNKPRFFSTSKTHDKMDLRFKDLKCPCCQSEMVQGTIHAGVDFQLVKKCSSCEFWMIIVVPHKDYDYSVKREYKLKTHTI